MAFGAVVSTTGFSPTLGPITLSSVPAGSTILVFCYGDSTLAAPTDNFSSTYTLIGFAINAAGVYKTTNVTGGTYNITGNWPTGNGQTLIAAWYSNGDVSGTGYVVDDSFVSGANALTHAVTPVADNALLVGWVRGSGSTYTAGTSPNAFTARATGIATTLTLLEDFQLSTGTGGFSQTITMGASSGSSGQQCAFIALAALGGGPSPGPLPRQIYIMP